MEFRRLELNGGRVIRTNTWQLLLPPTAAGYADAQIDDYGEAGGREQYPWRPGMYLSLRARFAPGEGRLLGTAGFGFWNAPFGDPTVKRPALPQAAWFFYASPPSDLPFPPDEPGVGWFAATIDAAAPRALATVPFAPAVLLLNQLRRLRSLVWPPVRRALGISHASLPQKMTAWHQYELRWLARGCTFLVDGEVVLSSTYSPRGPLGFVCGLETQYMVATPRGRLRWGTLKTTVTQQLEITDLELRPVY